jgi:methylenetetrahydrofolate reductase (NADPH)
MVNNKNKKRGVFPSMEILQPTIVDFESFVAWKKEAFSLWKVDWGSIYDKESESYKLIENIVSDSFLVNIVDNDFIDGNIFNIFDDVIDNDIDISDVELL